MIAAALLALVLASPIIPANIIDGTDDRGSLLALGPSLGLSGDEIRRIRQVSGHVGCFSPALKVGSGALFLADDLVLTAAHMFFEAGKRQTKCYFRAQAPGADWITLKAGPGDIRFGAANPKPGSNNDWAIVRLSTPLTGADPFPPDDTPPMAGDPLIVVSAHPDGMEDVPLDVPVVQGCTVRRVPISSAATSFYRTDCDASPASSGGMHLHRGADGVLRFRGITISTGPWSDDGLRGAPYDEKAGSVTTALGTDAAILAAGNQLVGLPAD
ncbi:MAG TPA: trypsin-like peptidase domain-containing protein [Bauldia sp.]|nr:trypsin-like peptidase domain-containing protein [Bauldia sp.]